MPAVDVLPRCLGAQQIKHPDPAGYLSEVRAAGQGHIPRLRPQEVDQRLVAAAEAQSPLVPGGPDLDAEDMALALRALNAVLASPVPGPSRALRSAAAAGDTW